MNLIQLFVEPVARYGFMQAGLTAALIVGVVSAVLSCLLVVRHQALLGDAISHAVLLGVAVGYLLARQAGIFWGALVVAVLTGLAITYIERHSPVKLDAVMGICFTATFALGLAIISVAKPRGIDLFHILFGNVLGVSSSDLVLTGASGAAVLVTVVVLFRPFHLWSFDPLMAEAVGLRVGLLQYVFTALLSATIVAALQAVGLILVIAMLITPGATALLLTSRLRTMMLVAAGVGSLSAVGGLYGSYYYDVASGPAIVLVATACFAVALFCAPRGGVLARAVRRRRSADRTLAEDVLKALFSPDDTDAAIPVATLEQRVGTGPERIRRPLRGLVRHRLVTLDGGNVTLTAAGRAQALRMVRTHRLLERYVHEAEGVPLHELHDLAEELEHDVDETALSDIDRILGSPGTDPHGHPIPSPSGELAAIAGRPLAECPVGEQGVVTMVGDDRADLLAAMVEAGILPQRTVTVLGHGDDGLRARVGEREVVLPAEVAQRVYVVDGQRLSRPMEGAVRADSPAP
ncbi:MAG: metal ABC transporter permease [Euzebyales bacterium]|nr:metal ABC transporter permease [Euzebyales bacterium]MBA3620756.1 metal ABC transporter permease [Euzebyales bacterium]